MRTLMLAGLAVLVACGGGSPLGVGGTSIDGDWAGTSESGMDVELTLSESGGIITGSGAILGGDSPIRLDVSGEWDDPTFEMVWESHLLSDVTYAGEFRGGELVGSLVGSGTGGARLTMQRQ